MRSAANTARNAGDTATADALENAANTLASQKPSDASAISASISAEGLSTIDYTAPDLSGAKIDTSKIPSADVKIDVPDINALSTSLKAIQNKYESIVETVNKLDLKGMQKQLDELSDPDNLPNIDVSELKPSVTKLNEGMKALSAAIGTLSTKRSNPRQQDRRFCSCICWYPADHLRLCRAYKEQRSTDYRRSDPCKERSDAE
ncbi:MAG: hypothetical protein ACLTSZ_04170 [Lachnospiraceae bacterium]